MQRKRTDFKIDSRSIFLIVQAKNAMARTEAIRIIFERPYGGEANNVLRGLVHPNRFHLPNSFYRRMKSRHINGNTTSRSEIASSHKKNSFLQNALSYLLYILIY